MDDVECTALRGWTVSSETVSRECDVGVSHCWFLVARLFCLFRFGGFESGLKKGLTETEIAVKCIGSTGRNDCPCSLTK